MSSAIETETPWIDAWIRWDRNSKDIIDDEEEEEEERVPPTTEFSFQYRLDSTRTSTDSNLTLRLKGFPSESEQIWNSTGLTLWPSSHYLCEYLLDHHKQLLGFQQDKHNNTPRTIRAVELGSGLGRCGLLFHHLASRFGSDITSHMYMTDGDTDTLAQLRDNVVDNTTNDENDSSHAVSCHQLLWGTESTQKFCDHQGSNQVDLVFGSDLVYAPKVIQPLFETISILLTDSNKFLMAHSDRREGSSVTLTMVLEGAKNAGLEYEILETIEREGIYIIAFSIAHDS